jgi:hypothetical protein
MKASILNAESGNIGTIASGCRSLGHDAIWTDPLFFRCFSANAIFRRLEAQPDRRLSQRSPLRRPGMIILGHASSADWSKRLRRSVQHDLPPTSPTATHRAIGTSTGARISRSRSDRDSIMPASRKGTSRRSAYDPTAPICPDRIHAARALGGPCILGSLP